MLSLNPKSIAAARRHPLFPKLMEICRSRMKWKDSMKLGDGKACATTLHHWGVLWASHGVPNEDVWDMALSKLLATWGQIPEKDLVRNVVPAFCDAWQLSKWSEGVGELLERFVDAAPVGISPGSALYARVLALETLGRHGEARSCALDGFPGHPGLLEFFGTSKYLRKCGIPKYGVMSRWVQAGWGDWCCLLEAYRIDFNLVVDNTGGSTAQRISAYSNLPYTLYMADGNLVRGGDDAGNDPAPYLPVPGVIRGADAKSRWLRKRSIADNPPNLRCLTFGSEGDVAAGLPRAAKAKNDYPILDDDGTLLLTIGKNKLWATWHKSPWTNVAGGGHSWPNRFPVTDRIVGDKREIVYG